MASTDSKPATNEGSSSCVNCNLLFEDAIRHGWALRFSSQGVYRSMLRKVDAILGHQWPEHVSTEQVLALIEQAYPDNFNTQAKLWGALRLLFTHQRLLPGEPWLLALEPLAARFHRKQPVTRPQPPQEGLLDAAIGFVSETGNWKQQRNLALVSVFEACALKPAEARELVVGDVTLLEKSARLQIRKRRGHRFVEVDGRHYVALRAYVEKHPQKGCAESIFFCSDSAGTRKLDNSTIHRILYRAAAAAAAPKEQVATGALRLAKAQDMLANGAAVRDIQKFLGHSQLESTLEFLKKLRVD